MIKSKTREKDTVNIAEDSLAKEQYPLPTSEFTEEDIEKMGETEFKTFVIQLLINHEKHIKQACKKFKE